MFSGLGCRCGLQEVEVFGDGHRPSNKNGRFEKKNYAFTQQKFINAPLHKTKSVPDKRPFPRNNSGPAGFRNQVAANGSVHAELGSLSRPGSKKGGQAQKLNWSEQYDSGRHWDHRLPTRKRYLSSSTGDFNKERYLQANCQFVVSDAFDYSLNLLDPNLLVDWEQIEEMRLLCDEMPSCPICLYPPVAAKITRCGHIYCWSCILHYLALSDKQWRKCPICFESVYGKQLKSVVANRVEKVAVDTTIRMRLMSRPKGSTIALPVGEWKNHHGEMLNVEERCSQYSKLLKVDHQTVCNTIIKREREELQVQLALEKDEPESCFIQQALDYLDEREEAVHKALTLREVPSSPLLARSVSPERISQQLCHQDTGVSFFIDAFENLEAKGWSPACQQVSHPSMSGCQSTKSDSVVPFAENSTKELDISKNCVYFYQAEDGQQIYMSPFNVKCLVHQYGSLEEAPDIVSGKVLQLDNFVMTESIRQRFRYISHLPLSTCFELAEIRFSPGILSRESVSYFADEFSRRKQARVKRDKEDKRRAIKAERWDRACLMDPANYTLAKMPSCPVPDIPVITYVASAQQDIEANLAQGTSDISPPAPPVFQEPPANVEVVSEEEFTHSPPSFAQMLKSGKPKPSAKPMGVQEDVGRREADAQTEDSENCLVPAYHNTFGDVLQAAFDNLKMEDGEKSQAKHKKGKKKKGKILFAT